MVEYPNDILFGTQFLKYISEICQKKSDDLRQDN